MWRPKLLTIPSVEDALPGRDTPIPTSRYHYVNDAPLLGDCPPNQHEIVLGLGCFWGAERAFWQLPGVVSTSVGYAGGHTPNPEYEEVCSGMTGHNEVVRVRFDPQRISLEQVLACFWESHDPTQGMRQGNDIGTQYRSGIYVTDAQDLAIAEASRVQYQSRLTAAGMGEVTTEIRVGVPFYLAEAWHQQYLAKNPNG